MENGFAYGADPDLSRALQLVEVFGGGLAVDAEKVRNLLDGQAFGVLPKQVQNALDM